MRHPIAAIQRMLPDRVSRALKRNQLLRRWVRLAKGLPPHDAPIPGPLPVPNPAAPADDPLADYPTPAPPMKVADGLDLLVLELPPRYMPLMPNGLGYVDRILARCDCRYQILDANIAVYHRFHRRRLLAGRPPLLAPDGPEAPEDPWDNVCTGEWVKEQVIDYFWPDMGELLWKIVRARPKAVGISLSGLNRRLVERFVRELRRMLPGVLIVVGGYDCVYHELGPFLFRDYDYMVIGESDLTLPALAEAIARDGRPGDLPGIVSRFDTPGRVWEPPALLEDLDANGWPTYSWAELRWYQTHHRKHLVPITGSRGCNWGRCRFCCECFRFRKRDPRKVAEEIQHFAAQGFHTFHFNESDVNGDPANLYDICSETLRRGLRIALVGQLRVDRRNTAEYFRHLARAGFRHLRFGVDGWNDRLLRLQNKGYTMAMVFQNLRDCHAAGITTTVNVVLGVPGETDQDVEEVIENLIRCKGCIHSIESLNTLLLACGSEYYLNPDRHNIRFRRPREQICAEYADYVPTDLWYSEQPYIDQDVRMRRLERILDAMTEHGIQVGGFAQGVVEKLRNRAPESAACAGIESRAR